MNFAHAGNLRPPCKPGWPRTWKRLLLQALLVVAILSAFTVVWPARKLMNCPLKKGTIAKRAKQIDFCSCKKWFVCEETSRCGNSLLGIEGGASSECNEAFKRSESNSTILRESSRRPTWTQSWKQRKLLKRCKAGNCTSPRTAHCVSLWSKLASYQKCCMCRMNESALNDV